MAQACAVRGDASGRDPSGKTFRPIQQALSSSLRPGGDPPKKTLCLAWQVPPSFLCREGFCRQEGDREGQFA